jgi:hypothetical protein
MAKSHVDAPFRTVTLLVADTAHVALFEIVAPAE